jgi:hypothetical protein
MKQNPKTQIPSSRESSKAKFQKIKIAAFCVFRNLMFFEICLGFGIWDLEFREA